jgi:hypothetical protein
MPRVPSSRGGQRMRASCRHTLRRPVDGVTRQRHSHEHEALHAVPSLLSSSPSARSLPPCLSSFRVPPLASFGASDSRSLAGRRSDFPFRIFGLGEWAGEGWLPSWVGDASGRSPCGCSCSFQLGEGRQSEQPGNGVPWGGVRAGRDFACGRFPAAVLGPAVALGWVGGLVGGSEGFSGGWVGNSRVLARFWPACPFAERGERACEFFSL